MRSRSYLISAWSGMALTRTRERHVGRHRLGATGTEPRQSRAPRWWPFRHRGRHRQDPDTSIWPPATAS